MPKETESAHVATGNNKGKEEEEELPQPKDIHQLLQQMLYESRQFDLFTHGHLLVNLGNNPFDKDKNVVFLITLLQSLSSIMLGMPEELQVRPFCVFCCSDSRGFII